MVDEGGRQVPGVLTAFIAALCYSVSYLFVRKGQAESNPEDHGLFPVLLISSLTLALALLVKVMRNAAPLVMGPHQALTISFCILAGILGTCFGRMALYAAIARIGATRGVIIDMLSAFVTLTAAIIFLGEKLRWSNIYGVIGITLGLTLLITERVWFPSRFMKQLYQSGVAMSFAAALLQGVGHVFRKPSVVSPISPTFAATLDIVAALLLYTLLLGWNGRLTRVLRHYRRTGSSNLYFAAAGCFSAAGVLLFFSASSTIPVSQVSIITSIQPVIVAVLSGVLLAKLEQITWFTVMSSICVTLGVIIMSL